MRVLDLFSGIGGLSLGLERAGMTTVGFCEIEEFPRRVLAKHWPNVPIFKDVRDVTNELIWRECGPIDLICGGFPCQPHSLAGKQEASADERDLWPAYRRLICEVKPRWIVAENVGGLLSSESGRFFAGVLRDLATLGYDAEWRCFPAASVGAPHSRDRVWIVAYPRSEGLSRLILNGEALPVTTRTSLTQFGDKLIPCGLQWKADRERLSMGNGLSPGLVRGAVKALGNAVVPQVAELIGKAIMNAAMTQRSAN